MGCDRDRFSTSIMTPIGELCIRACETGLHSITRRDCDGYPVKPLGPRNFVTDATVAWVEWYFNHHADPHEEHDVKLCLVGRSSFQVSVWNTLKTATKFGQTISYADLAKEATGKRRAARAVGSAMRNNPFILLVPCHRVVTSSGTLGRYSGGGTRIKEYLIEHERARLYTAEYAKKEQ